MNDPLADAEEKSLEQRKVEKMSPPAYVKKAYRVVCPVHKLVSFHVIAETPEEAREIIRNANVETLVEEHSPYPACDSWWDVRENLLEPEEVLEVETGETVWSNFERKS